MNKILKILIPILIILGLVLTAGCAKAPATTPAPLPPGAAIPESSRGGSGEDYYKDQYSNAPTESGQADIDRKIIKNGYMTLEVNDIPEAIAGITGVANELNGYVVSSDQSGNKDIT